MKAPPAWSNEAFWSAGALGILATAVAAILPVLLSVWQAQAGLRVDQAGFVAATELFAQVAGTGAFLWASRRWTLRRIAAVGLSVMIVGNLATAVSVDFISLLLSRAVGGAGGGLLRALCMMCLARAMSPGRAFALYASAQVGLAALTTAVIPHWIELQGPRAPFLALSAMCLVGFALCPLLPRHSAVATDAPPNVRATASPPASAVDGSIRGGRDGFIPPSAILAVSALFIFFAGQGALWTYLGPIGADRSVPASGVLQTLAWLNVAGLAGALGVGALAHRLNPRIALLTLLATETVSIFGLFNSHSSMAFMACACGFYFSWCASFPFQFTVIAQSDSSGRASAVVSAADGLGLAGGAALSGMVLPAFGLASAGWICMAASVIGVVLYLASATLSKMPRQFLRRAVEVTAATSEG